MYKALASALVLPAALLIGCGDVSDSADECPAGQVRDGDRCIPDTGDNPDAAPSVDAADIDAGTSTADAGDTDAGGVDAGHPDAGPPDLYPAITFDDSAVTYTFLGFEGAEDSSVQTDPTNASNKVARVVRSNTAKTFAGTVVSTEANNSILAIPFDADNTIMSVRTYSPAAGLTVRLALENQNDSGTQVFVDATTTVADAFETLTFDFANTGGAALNLAQTYDKVIIFFNFGVDGATAGAQTFYFDDIDFIGGGGLPPVAGPFQDITFDDSSVTYALLGFGGADDSTIVADPDNGALKVAQVARSATAETWAGTTVVTGPNNTVGKIPFDASNTRISVRVLSPAAGIPVRLKVEDSTNGATSVETEATTTTAGAFEVLTFDFANEAGGTPALNVANTYDKLTIFFNFGTSGADAGAQTFLFDDIDFIGGGGIGGTGRPAFKDVTFDDGSVTYSLLGFGGADDSTIVADPGNSALKVAQVNRTGTAETWAGTTVITAANNAVGVIPFTATATTMTVRVQSPATGIQVRLKVEDSTNPSISVETEATVTTPNSFEVLTFDFANQAAGTAALNVANTYDKLSIFFNFGTSGADAGAQTFLFDDITFVP